MKIKEITYERIFPLKEKFSNERLSVTIQIEGKETVASAFKRAKTEVVKSSTRYKEIQDAQANLLDEVDFE